MTAPAIFSNLRRTALMLGGALLVAVPLATPAHAQDDAQRIRKLEAEVKALQRKVFPGGSDKYFQPEIVAPETQATNPAFNTSGPVTDLLARMDSVESALQSLTAQVESNTNAMRLMNARVEQLEAEAEQFRAMQNPAAADVAAAADTAMGNNLSAMSGTPTPGPAPVPAAAAPAPTTPVAAIEKPSTGDDADDTYVYGYRLWDAGQYGPARTELQKVVNLYPDHRRASWARNLIGRSWLDEGQPGKAGEAFLANYLNNRSGERAPDSLVYLARATLALGNKTKSCEALSEFRRVYPNEAAGRLSSIANETGREAGCN
ncbi:tetratricopeptide repeat protein [Croceicoccus mobilis]|uniref:YbgF trimerisation domain-containing protein n=1 Tax=Croceicoccus mobilis TaxID=1703339 RepID=A0A916Z1F1_9SPHN|nr:tetratricopeptide repeat protein [Croceicoccus mobilis]GGD71944.1 hypothetical protein GCM10010990_21760 [Croceicoccus mobilis]